MACRLLEAIELLNKQPATRNAITAIVKSGEIAEKAFGELVMNITGEKAPSMVKFAKELSKYIRKVTGVTVEKSKEFILNQVTTYSDGYLTKAELHLPSNTIKLGAYVPKKDLKSTLESKLYSELATAYGRETADRITSDKETNDAVNAKVTKMFNSIKDARGTNVLLHELTHVGAAEYMALNPDARATKRINTIYNYLFQNYEQFGLSKDDYWRTSVDEFVAEAMSNTRLITTLMQIKPTKPISRLANLYEVVLNTLTSMLGLKKDQMETLFDILLDANVSILQDAGMLSKVQKGTQDTLTASEGKSTRESGKGVPEAAKGNKVTYDSGVKLELVKVLKSATRMTSLIGEVPDPIAVDLLVSSKNLMQLEAVLIELGVTEVNSLLGAGASSIVYSTNKGALRLGNGKVFNSIKSDNVLQQIAKGSVGSIRYELYPEVDTANVTNKDVMQLEKLLNAEGINFVDKGTDNVGRLNGRLVVIDPGAVVKADRSSQKGLGATNKTEVSELNEVIISDEEYEAIKESNQYYKDKHPKMFTFGEEYMYDTDNNIITLIEPGTSSDVDERMHEVYTAHEIKHALTFEYLNDGKNKDVVTYLNNAIKVALDKFVPDYTIEGALLLDRLDYARRTGGVTSAAELVAILASEPNIRSKFIELFPQTQRTKLENILDNIKAFIAKMMGTDISDVIATVDAIVAQGKITEGKLPIQGFDKLFANKSLDSIYFETKKKAAEGVKRLMDTSSVEEYVTDNAEIEDSILRKMNNEITIVKNGKKWKNIPLKKVLLNKDKTEITITAIMGKSWVSYTFPIDKATSKPTANGYTVTNEWLYHIAPQAIAQAKTQKKSKVVVLPIGTSGSGKSTWIKTLPKNKYVVISPDEMRVEFTGDMNDKSKDTEIYKAVITRTLKAIADGKQVIIDSTNLQKERRRDFIDSVRAADSSIDIQYKLMPLNPEVAKQRIKKDIADGVDRANVPDSTIDRHAKLYTDMLNDIKEEGMTEFKESAIMPTPVSSEAMLKANAIIELAKKKCKG